MMNNKRRDASPAMSNISKKPRKECIYGENCYRRNPAHLREFCHPHLESILDNYSGQGEFPIPENLILQKEMMQEQLQIILEKNLYSPSSSKLSVVSATTHRPDDENSSQELATADARDGQSSSHIDKIKAENEESKDVNKHMKENKVVKNGSATVDPTSKHLAYSDYRPIVLPKRNIRDHFKVVLPKGRMLEKHQKSAPYHVFYTTITSCRETHSQESSITFQELLDLSLGELKCSLQINFMVDIGWLLAQYYFAGYSQKRLTILYGDNNPDLVAVGEKQKQVDAHFVNMGSPFGKHHTKIMLLCYEDGSLRVVISSANLYLDDWENRTQGLWMSPSCPELPEDSMPHEGDSPTGFKRSLLDYLNHYRMGYLTQYVARVSKCDFSHINVFLIASVPGGHTDDRWGMLRVGSVLSRHCAAADEPAALVAQASSIGSYGHSPNLWLTKDFLSNFSRTNNESAFVTSQPKLKIIFPSLENVQQSHDGLLGGGCLPYSAAVHTKQQWLRDFLYQWKAESSHRNKAMPHIKTYLKVSEDCKKAYYFLLTSANLSKAAWGTVNKGNKALRIMSYEAGVLFLPRFVLDRDLFPLDIAAAAAAAPRLPLPYDLPPVRYLGAMSPFVQDYLLD